MSFTHWSIGKETVRQQISFQDLILRWILNDPRGASTLIYDWTIFENMQCKIYSHNSVYIRHGDVKMPALPYQKSLWIFLEYFNHHIIINSTITSVKAVHSFDCFYTFERIIKSHFETLNRKLQGWVSATYREIYNDIYYKQIINHIEWLHTQIYFCNITYT